MKRVNYMPILTVICILSYVMMVHKLTAGAEDIQIYYKLPQDPVVDSYIYNARESYMRESKLIQYVEQLTGLDIMHCKLLIEESKEKNIDPFIVLGVIKRESNFNPLARGIDGERGLGQLMESTAKIISENLGYDYNYDRLLEPQYNLKLTITQLSYLRSLYEKDMHKTLTAYNRGQQGLKNYIENVNTNGESSYSAGVLLLAKEYKEAFDNSMK